MKNEIVEMSPTVIRVVKLYNKQNPGVSLTFDVVSIEVRGQKKFIRVLKIDQPVLS